MYLDRRSKILVMWKDLFVAVSAHVGWVKPSHFNVTVMQTKNGTFSKRDGQRLRLAPI